LTKEISNEPVIIELASFTATAGSEKVTLTWVTESEINNAGFNIYRSETKKGKYEKMTAKMIPAKGSASKGSEYEFIDDDVRNRQTYWYKLEDVDLNGVTTMHDPVSAMPRLLYGIGR